METFDLMLQIVILFAMLVGVPVLYATLKALWQRNILQKFYDEKFGRKLPIRYFSNAYYKSDKYKKSKAYQKYHKLYYGDTSSQEKKISSHEGFSESNSHSPSIYTQDSSLDAAINEILEKSQALLSNRLIEQNLPLKLRILDVRNKYLPKIIQTYQSIPIHSRNKIHQGSSAYEMTKEQLFTVKEGLIAIELQLLQEQHKQMRIHSKILNATFEQEI